MAYVKLPYLIFFSAVCGLFFVCLHFLKLSKNTENKYYVIEWASLKVYKLFVTVMLGECVLIKREKK